MANHKQQKSVYNGEENPGPQKDVYVQAEHDGYHIEEIYDEETVADLVGEAEEADSEDGNKAGRDSEMEEYEVDAIFKNDDIDNEYDDRSLKKNQEVIIKSRGTKRQRTSSSSDSQQDSILKESKNVRGDRAKRISTRYKKPSKSDRTSVTKQPRHGTIRQAKANKD